MKSTIIKLAGMTLLVHGLTRNWTDWQGVLYGVTAGVFLKTVLDSYNEMER